MRSSFFRVPTGSLLLVLVYATATVVLAVNGITQPEHRNVALLMVAIGLAGTWREYVNWRRTRDARLGAR